MSLLITKDNVVKGACMVVRSVGTFELAGHLTVAQIADKFRPLIKFHKQHEDCYMWKLPIHGEEYTFQTIYMLGPNPDCIIFAIDHDIINGREVLDTWNKDIKDWLCNEEAPNDCYRVVRKFNEMEWNDFIHRIHEYIYSYNHSEDK